MIGINIKWCLIQNHGTDDKKLKNIKNMRKQNI